MLNNMSLSCQTQFQSSKKLGIYIKFILENRCSLLILISKIYNKKKINVCKYSSNFSSCKKLFTFQTSIIFWGGGGGEFIFISLPINFLSTNKKLKNSSYLRATFEHYKVPHGSFKNFLLQYIDYEIILCPFKWTPKFKRLT